MRNINSEQEYEIGMVGLGVMGRNLLLNIADHGFSAVGYDNDPDKVEALRQEAEERNIHCTGNLQEFILNLRKPRAIILLVPAGAPVDSVINEMLVYLEKDDLFIDSGNSYFKDTNLRIIRLEEKGIQFMGMGISGGEEGARHGASIMPGGLKEAYERIRPILEAVAARVNDEPCVTYLGNWQTKYFSAKNLNLLVIGKSFWYNCVKLCMYQCSQPIHKVLQFWQWHQVNTDITWIWKW